MKNPLMLPSRLLIDLADIRAIYPDKQSMEFVIWLKDNKEIRISEQLGAGLLEKLNLKEIWDSLKD